MLLQGTADKEFADLFSDFHRYVAPGIAVSIKDPRTPRSAVFPEEAAVLPAMRALRRREFLAGREALRQAMSSLGIEPAPIPMRDDRAPDLPETVSASVSHSETLCVAIADLKTRSAGLGIDVEPAERLDQTLWETVCTRNERQWLMSQPADQQSFLAKDIFCAKEAAYKCQYALSKVMIDFDEFDVSFLPGARFHATFRNGVGPFAASDRICGRIWQIADHVIAVARIPA